MFQTPFINHILKILALSRGITYFDKPDWVNGLSGEFQQSLRLYATSIRLVYTNKAYWSRWECFKHLSSTTFGKFWPYRMVSRTLTSRTGEMGLSGEFQQSLRLHATSIRLVYTNKRYCNRWECFKQLSSTTFDKFWSYRVVFRTLKSRMVEMDCPVSSNSL